jgi:hypothetical protein
MLGLSAQYGYAVLQANPVDEVVLPSVNHNIGERSCQVSSPRQDDQVEATLTQNVDVLRRCVAGFDLPRNPAVIEKVHDLPPRRRFVRTR